MDYRDNDFIMVDTPYTEEKHTENFEQKKKKSLYILREKCLSLR